MTFLLLALFVCCVMLGVSIKEEYAASSSLTITLTSLATSSTWLTGRQSTAVDNTTNKYLDYLLAGFIKVGTPAISTGEIRVYVVALENDSTWPDVFGASDAGVSILSAGMGSGYLKLAAVMSVDSTTASRIYYFGPVSVASLFGGAVPKKWVAFVTHNTGANLDATAGGTLDITPVYATAA